MAFTRLRLPESRAKAQFRISSRSPSRLALGWGTTDLTERAFMDFSFKDRKWLLYPTKGVKHQPAIARNGPEMKKVAKINLKNDHLSSLPFNEADGPVILSGQRGRHY